MTEIYDEEKVKPLSEEERLAQKVEELNKVVSTETEVGGNVDASSMIASTSLRVI